MSPAAARSVWLPREHGAWAFLLLPYLAGVALAPPRPVLLPLGMTWIGGYLLLAGLTPWLTARRRRPPRDLAVLAALVAASAVVTIALAPWLLAWALAYVPLVSASVWWTVRGQARTLRNDATTMLAAALSTAVVVDATGTALDSRVWLTVVVLFAYFFGTALSVKTMLRQRGERRYVTASVLYHAALVPGAVAVILVSGAPPSRAWPLVVVAFVLLGRAIAGPLVNRRRARPLRPAVVGAGEIVLSVAVLAATLLLH